MRILKPEEGVEAYNTMMGPSFMQGMAQALEVPRSTASDGDIAYAKSRFNSGHEVAKMEWENTFKAHQESRRMAAEFLLEVARALMINIPRRGE